MKIRRPMKIRINDPLGKLTAVWASSWECWGLDAMSGVSSDGDTGLCAMVNVNEALL
jgi:hypothetical protein